MIKNVLTEIITQIEVVWIRISLISLKIIFLDPYLGLIVKLTMRF